MEIVFTGSALKSLKHCLNGAQLLEFFDWFHEHLETDPSDEILEAGGECRGSLAIYREAFGVIYSVDASIVTIANFIPMAVTRRKLPKVVSFPG